MFNFSIQNEWFILSIQFTLFMKEAIHKNHCPDCGHLWNNGWEHGYPLFQGIVEPECEKYECIKEVEQQDFFNKNGFCSKDCKKCFIS